MVRLLWKLEKAADNYGAKRRQNRELSTGRRTLGRSYRTFIMNPARRDGRHTHRRGADYY